ncbi:hypothetical protein GALMADRAFT_243589 [Galerina marginata CBS 339.88]|uniref:NCA2-domain-containing protein n=1 Tax=Galerina marginata (strain CBS 339.88) TaxID=685588 RepID=A0A067TKM0_GALM3|nr:hypothetical protein GALMADRAFT_243589 [Galerina marginata CBS 339.88]
MPAEFVVHFTRFLELSTSRPGSPLPSPLGDKGPIDFSTSDTTNSRKSALHALLVSLNQNAVPLNEIHDSLNSLQDILRSRGSISAGKADDKEYVSNSTLDSEEAALEAAIVGKLTVGLYCNALDMYLAQATEVEAEAEWWADVEASRMGVTLYFIETLPVRLFNVAKTIVRTIHAHRLPLNLSTLSPSSLRALFHSSSRFTLQPGLLTTTCFPHLRHQQSLSLAVLLPSSTSSSLSQLEISTSSSSTTRRFISTITRTLRRLMESASLALRCLNLPLDLTKQECRYNRKALEQIRDERAEVLGQLAQLRTPLAGLIKSTSSMGTNSLAQREYTSLLDTLIRVVFPTSISSSTSPIAPLEILSQTLPSISQAHTQTLRQHNLLRPSALTRLWPRLLIFPPLALYIYTSRTSWIPALIDMANDARETVHRFVQGWLVEPLLGVLHTVRDGGKGMVLVRDEGVKADLESLERMTLALARDSLHYSPTQLEALSEQVRMGDLTPVMQAYEEDIRSPLRSALTGTLLRNAFIQVQKAKVDIDQALTGIDRLLKSQELTFAFVGVAPALAIVWAFTGVIARAWNGGGDRYGGRKKRRGVWQRMRRIERILILQPSNTQTSSESQAPIAPLPTGLLILSLTRVRSYALKYLPPDIQGPFLEDLGDLEDTQLDREAKLRVVERMWRCWGQGQGRVIRQ